ncbi:MAG: hypothetical protein Q7S96_04960 [bacterium]|nr:hypothetical protein [bacterium]
MPSILPFDRHQEPKPERTRRERPAARGNDIAAELEEILGIAELTEPDIDAVDIVPPGFDVTLTERERDDAEDTTLTDAAEAIEPTEITPPNAGTSIHKAREAKEFAERLQAWEHHGPTMLAQTAKGYERILRELSAGTAVEPQKISNIQGRRDAFTRAKDMDDAATMERIIAEDRAFKQLAIAALEMVRGQVERSPIPESTLTEWERMGTGELEAIRDMYAKGVTKHEDRVKRSTMQPAEISRAYNLRETFVRAHATNQARLAAIVLEDDAWYKRAALDAINDILAKRLLDASDRALPLAS